jgi:flavodoxin
MKTIFIYYSRDGNTDFICKEMAEEMKADLLRVEEKKDRKGLIGYIKAGHDGMRGKDAELVGFKPELSEYERVIFAGPIWAWKPAPPILSAMKECDLGKKKVVNIVTMGSSCGKSLEIMGDLVKTQGGEVEDGFAFITANVSRDQLKDEVVSHAQKLIG